MGTQDFLLAQLRREQRAIEAIHLLPWWRIGILLRRPWRMRPFNLSDGIYWFTTVHDCQDPAVACSCHPSFRFPRHNQ